MNKPSPRWDLAQWLAYLEGCNKQEIQLGLARITQVARQLQLDKVEPLVITVAGTNGKGSTVAALESIYCQAGYRVGAYTSPHLLCFNERIRVNKIPIAPHALCRAFQFIEERRENTHLTYFEMTTLAALYYFKENPLDVIILEVGLGGRMDATNMIDADLAIITTIAFDHQDFLGNSLEAIGYEKAGILRDNQLFIYADHHPPKTIVDAAKRCKVHSYYLDKDFIAKEYDSHWDFSLDKQVLTDLPKPSIQLKSASAAIAAALLLHNKRPVDEKIFSQAMKDIFIPGRLQWEFGRPDILYDVSHNPQSAQLLAKTLKQKTNKAKVHAVFSALKDKDILGLINPLKDCVDYWYPAQLEVKRAPTRDFLLSQFNEAEIFVKFCYNNPLIAFKAALSQAQPDDLIVVYGSFFTVGQVMASKPQ